MYDFFFLVVSIWVIEFVLNKKLNKETLIPLLSFFGLLVMGLL